MGSLCYNIIMSISYIIHIVTFIIIFVMNIRSVNSKVHVLTAHDKLAVKVGHDIFAKMGKHGIELEKIEDDSDETLTEVLGSLDSLPGLSLGKHSTPPSSG